jgi:hypothetical protein
MGNPMLSSFFDKPVPQQQSSGLEETARAIKNSPNPQALMMTLMQSKPEYKQVMNYIQQNGGDARTAFYNMAAQKGVNPEQVLSTVRSLFNKS